MRQQNEGGQATVELALALPVVMMLLLVLIQVALVVRNQLAVQNAAREAARVAAVDPRPSAASTAATDAGLDHDATHVSVTGGKGTGGTVRVEVIYHDVTAVPLVGPMLPDLDLHATVAMQNERTHDPTGGS